MELTDEELMMLEQLTYMNSALGGCGTIDGRYVGMTVSDILKKFSDTKLENLASSDKEIDGACASGKEWAGIIHYLKNSRLKDLVLSETMVNNEGTTLALVFSDKSNPNDAIVAFKGTSGANEWGDNVEGLNSADTECQKEALDFIESLKYNNLTVVGHSKGGNKAMYVAITSDKVKKCVSLDGQGFSKEMIEKYSTEIKKKSNIITNYSVSTDYVHALLYPIPGSEQVYCEGYNIDNIKQHHSPNSFFSADKDGNLTLIYDKDGNMIPVINKTKESESIAMLHQFTTFVLNNADAEDKDKITSYISELLAIAFSDNSNELVNYALSDPDALALVLAYLVKYMDEYDLDSDDIDKLLNVLGLNSLNSIINIGQINIPGYTVDVNLNLANILNMIKKQLTDNDDDFFLTHIILPVLKNIFGKDYDIDVSALWKKINKKVKEIDTSEGKGDYGVKNNGSVILDFSKSALQIILDSISDINKNSINVSNWSNYSNEEWYSTLLVPHAIKAINTFFIKLNEINSICKNNIEDIFNNAEYIDKKNSAYLVMYKDYLNNGLIRINDSANGIGLHT